MTKINVLHFADIHIGMENFGHIDSSTGINSRVIDFLRRFDEVIDYGLSHEVDLVIFAGDAFKTRDPSPTLQREFARRVKRFVDAQVPVVMLVGNHDLPAMEKKASSIDIYRTLGVPNVIIGWEEGAARDRHEARQGAGGDRAVSHAPSLAGAGRASRQIDRGTGQGAARHRRR